MSDNTGKWWWALGGLVVGGGASYALLQRDGGAGDAASTRTFVESLMRGETVYVRAVDRHFDVALDPEDGLIDVCLVMAGTDEPAIVVGRSNVGPEDFRSDGELARDLVLPVFQDVLRDPQQKEELVRRMEEVVAGDDDDEDDQDDQDDQPQLEEQPR
jgi:hypothetical protein